MAAKEQFRGTSLTRGIVSPRDSQADMAVLVTGLDGDRDSLDVAITEAVSGRLVHPDDNSIPLRTATAHWLRDNDAKAGEADSAAAMVFLRYDKRSSGVADDETSFAAIANVDVRFETILWWGDDLSVPATAGSAEAITLKPDPGAGNPAIVVPTPNYLEVVIWEIEIPVVLSSSPISTIDSMVGTVNDGSFTIGGKSFAANELRFNGLRQRVTKIYDGSSTTYEFDVNYWYSRRRGGWYKSDLKINGSGASATYYADKSLMYEAATWSAPPT